jgi:hypothetical protein
MISHLVGRHHCHQRHQQQRSGDPTSSYSSTVQANRQKLEFCMFEPRCCALLQILSGASNGFNTGMPKQDIVLATAVATAVATATMGEMTASPASMQ